MREWLTVRKIAHFLFFTIRGLSNLFTCVTVATVRFFDLLLLLLAEDSEVCEVLDPIEKSFLSPWDLTSPRSRCPMGGHALGTPCDPPAPEASASDPVQTAGSSPSHWATSVWRVASDPAWYGAGRGCSSPSRWAISVWRVASDPTWYGAVHGCMSTGRRNSVSDGVLIAWCGPGHGCISPDRSIQITMMRELLCWRGVGGFSRFLIRL